MIKCPISVDSTSEEIADFFEKEFKLTSEEKNKFINEGISGDVLLEIGNFKEVLGIRFMPNKKIRDFINDHQIFFQPKEIDKNISIKNEEEVKHFFEKYIGFNGNLNGIEGENELKQLKEEDMKKLGLNIGQRIKLTRIINHYFNDSKENEKEIIITITKDSSDEETINYLKNQLNISQKSLDNIGFDTKTLFDLDINTVNDFSKDGVASPEECERLKKFIKKRDELLGNGQISQTNKISDPKNIKKINKIENKDSEEICYSKKEKLPFQDNAHYNIFFIIALKSESLLDIDVATFQKKEEVLIPSYTNYNSYLLNISEYSNNKDIKYNLCLFQIVSDEKIKKICINIKGKDFIFEIEKSINDEDDNTFILDDFDKESVNDLLKITMNDYFSEYLNYFFDEKHHIKKTNIQRNLIKCLKSKISSTKDIKLSPKIILQFLHCLINLHMSSSAPNLDNIKIIHLEKDEQKLDKKFHVDSELVKNEFSYNDQKKIFTILIKIYSKFNDINLLLEIINSENDEYGRIFLDLIFLHKQIKFNDLKNRMNDNQIYMFQCSLFRAVSNQEEIEFIIRMRKGLENNLIIIKENLEHIKRVKFREKKKSFNKLKLDDPNKNDNIKNIVGILIGIVEFQKDYNIIEVKEIFGKMVDIYEDKNLEDYLLLQKSFEIKNIDTNILNRYYKNIHEKGMNMIKKNEMNTQEILNFIKNQDIYYSSDKYSKNENREPKIFSYIKISSDDENYKKNIELLKKSNLLGIYNNSNPNLQEEFYSVFLNQIKKFNDMTNIFELFDDDSIKNILLNLIHKKLKELINNIQDEKNIKISYEIINKWITCTSKNGTLEELKEIIHILYDMIQFTTNYYFTIMKEQECKQIVEIIKDHIIDFFDKHYEEKAIKESTLIKVLKYSNNNDFKKDFLKTMERKILTENDFYSYDDSPNFEFFKLFMENYTEDIKENLKECKYIIQSLETQTKIINDLKDKKVEFNKLKNSLLNENKFLNKLKVLENKDAEEIFKELKKSLNECENKLNELDLIKDYYDQFYKESKKDQIDLIKDKLVELRKSDIIFILNNNNFFEDNKSFNFNKAKEESKNIKYGNSKFFMAIYDKNKENDKLSEDEIFKQSIQNYRGVLVNIITQKEKELKIFEIPNISIILKIVNDYKYNLEEEIQFTIEEFKDLNKESYIKNNLLDDLIKYSQKDIISKLLEGILRFIDTFKELKIIEKTEFREEIIKLDSKIGDENISKEEIAETINILKEKGFDINNETSLIKFYKSVKKDAFIFLKSLMDSKLEIRNLNEFIVENAASELQTSDIDNLIYIFEFFKNIFDNEDINTDKSFIDIFGKEFNNNEEIFERLESYQKIYGEIKRVYQLYDENPIMTIEKIKMLIEDSSIEIYKDDLKDYITFRMIYKKKIDNIENEEIVDIKGLEELRNKILISSNNSKTLKGEKENEILDKMKIYKEYRDLIDNIKQLTSTLNNLLHIGYPYIVDLKLYVKNSGAKDENYKDLKDIIKDFKNQNIKFSNSIKEAYEKFPLLRLFYGQQFIQIYNQVKNKESKNLFFLMNSVCLNKINNINIDYVYDKNISELYNINKYLEQLFKYNNINYHQLFEPNIIVEDQNISPGLYRKVKSASNNDMINNILNIYLNITNHIPIINTLLICNKDTSIENIQSFLYRAMLCDRPILFLISNIEYLDLSKINNTIKLIKYLYKEKRNKNINSFILFLYEKVESGFARFLEKLIPEKNNLDSSYSNPPKKEFKEYEKIEIYSSDVSGYGKTTEIKNKVKDNKGKYYYLPIGGTFNRDYLIKNLINLNINLKRGNRNYLHLDLSDTDDNDLMIEILFKLLILRYIDSKRNLYYLGYDIHLLIEIPNGYYKFDDKYKLLNLFHRVHIKKLCPLRLEENINYVRDSPISIVAEVLLLYIQKKIGRQNINLSSPITKSAEECEKIINQYFEVENQSYYQKMNFIKILSIQFRKFTEDSILDLATYEGDDIKCEMMAAIRPIIISNLIELTKVFTRSPYDSVLLRQNKNMMIFGKINENQAKKEEIMMMADDSYKQEIFSFEKIKPSLVFFNRDGYSLSIISNKKEEKHYKELMLLWNSNNKILGNMDLKSLVEIINHGEMKELNELIDYKNLNHEQYLEEIKNIFSLDKLSVEELKGICVKLGNYVFVSDNFIKMVRILLNIEAKIPVILMGETGVGKTKLLEMLATLYGGGTAKWHKLQIHAGITDEKIIEFIDDLNKKYCEQENKKGELIWIFFDEINTCNSLGLITEIMCNHTYLGKKINDNFVFLGACNPYRVNNKTIRESGLSNLKDQNKYSDLVYTVNPLPHSLLNFIFDFGSLKPEDEKKYIINSINDILTRFKKNEVIPDFDKIDENKIEIIKEEISESIIICHDFLRTKFDSSSVSLREIRRFGIFFEYFIKYYKKNNYDTLKNSLNMTLYLNYYLRLNDKDSRTDLSNKLKKIFDNFLDIPEREIKSITDDMSIDKREGIALNRPLKENLFTCFICIDTCIPLIIVGKPGTGKSLNFQILYNSLRGEYSEYERFKEKGKLYRYYYQGSGSSTSEGIEQVFKKALIAKKSNENSKNKIITLVFFDEMGLAERSKNNPLKIIHYLLEQDAEKSVPFLGISNWSLDAAKINRALNLSISDYTLEDLEETAITIAKALDKDIANKNNDFFKILSKTFYEYLENKNMLKENRDFHGNRDFYYMIKTAVRELIERKEELNLTKKKVLTEVGLHTLDRNFSGLEGSNKKIKEIFKELFKHDYEESVEYNKQFTVLDAIKKNISDSNARYLMLISEGNDGRDIVKYLLNSENKGYIELIGSKYKSDLISGRYSEEILNKIKYIMETDNVLILKDLDMIYPSLYDLFNQNFIMMGEKKFARIAYEFAKVSGEVNKEFHVIVMVNKNQIKNLKIDPPFLNRFEKHIINFGIILEERDLEIAKKISNYIKLISSFNNNPKLRIDLDKLLINCRLNNIEGLIFKIKTNIHKDNDKLLKSEEYEKYIIKEVFKRIVPIFCQDIIGSVINSEIKQKDYNDIVLEIYNKSNRFNFISFFENIKQKRNIIYTFTKITEDIFKEEYLKKNKDIKNIFGIFNKQSSTIEVIDSIKSESDLVFLLKTFNESGRNLLILRFTEKDLNKISLIHFIINNLENEYPKLKDKIIILMIHKNRLLKSENIYLEEEPELISFFNDDYYQIFIDNLHGKENLKISELFQNTSIVAEKYIYNKKFIENNIFKIINYLNYKILFETKDLNNRNYASKITEMVLNNDFLKKNIIISLKNQGKNLPNCAKDIYFSDVIEINDIDFIEIISTKLSSIYFQFLLKIIYSGLSDNILNPFIINKDINSLWKNDYFNNLITNYFEKKENFNRKVKMDINGNEIIIYNGLKLPQSKQNINILIKFFKEISQRYSKNEESLRYVYRNDRQIIMKELDYKKNLGIFKDDLKFEIRKNDFLRKSFDLKYERILFEDYYVYFIIDCMANREIKYEHNEKLLKFLKLLIKIKLDTFEEENKSENEEKEPIDKFIIILMFTQGYKNDIKIFLEIYLEIVNYCDNLEEIMKNYLDEKKIKYEESQRSKKYTKTVNICLFSIIESFIRSILIFSKELIIKDKAKFKEYFKKFPLIETSLQKINKKYYLFSKEIYNLRNIIQIEEAYKDNYEQFENIYNEIIDNLFDQSFLFYSNNYNRLYDKIIALIKIIDDTFNQKNETYSNLLFFIFRQEYKNIYKEDIRIKLLEKFFNNELLLKHSKIFLVESLKILKPEIPFENKNEELIFNFMNIKSNKYSKIQNIITICDKINSEEFNEILLYFFEGLCQSYFFLILKRYNNEYNEKSCPEMLLGVSLEYLKKAMNYLFENKDEIKNYLLKIYAIAFIKSYCYFYVEIHKNYFDKCSWDAINKVLYDKDKINENIIKMINIYILRLYYNTFQNFEEFINYDLEKKNMPISNDITEKMKHESINDGYVFNESFITPKIYENYAILQNNIENENDNLYFDLINKNIDAYYCCLVNKTLSFKLGKNKDNIILKMKDIHFKTKEVIKLGEERKKIYEYLLIEGIFKNTIQTKISDGELTQNDFEILLYSLRFIFNTEENDNKFYYNLLRPKANDFIKNNFIPGAFQIINEFVRSYNILKIKLKNRSDFGYYICRDCGFLYEVEPCSFPDDILECINGHIIGGKDHICHKKDIRVFYERAEYDALKERWLMPEMNEWFDSFEPIMSLQEFKEKYVDNNLPVIEKGIIKKFESKYFENYDFVRDMDIISFRLLNFILYSYLFASNILQSLSDPEIQDYMIEGYEPKLFNVIKKDWELLDIALKKIGIKNVQIFLNMTFDKIIEMINNLNFVDTIEKLNSFENQVNQYIINIISNKENIEKMNNDYTELNQKLNDLSYNTMKEIIKSSFDPSKYDQKVYPDIRYYSVSSLQNYETFVKKFLSSMENERKYFLINLLIQKDQDLTKNTINLKNIQNINKLANLLINIYSYKISREDAKIYTLIQKLSEITILYNKMNENKDEYLEDNAFKKIFIDPFIESWNKIKDKCIKYKCNALKNGKEEGKPLDLSIDSALSYFLVDIGEQDGGMFLASAYENLIDWQNKLINLIIERNKENGILNIYIPQLEKEVAIQDATENDIIIIDDNTYLYLEELINNCSMRNILTKEGKIDYKNYYDNIYDYDYIETELAKIILQGKKKFKIDDIRCVTYKYEEFRGSQSSILISYNQKYPKKELSYEEKKILNELLKDKKNNNNFYRDISSFLQIIMKQVIIDNYAPNKLIYEIINNLPPFTILNDEFKTLLRNEYENNRKTFALDTLITIYEYFESLFWEETKKHIPEDFKLGLNSKEKEEILNYFERNKDNEKIIDKKNLTTALRRLISRFLVSSRQEVEIKSDLKLSLYIKREELWNNDYFENEEFNKEIMDIFKDNIKIGNSFCLYNILDGDKFLKMELGLDIKKEENNINEENNEEINPNDEFQEDINDDRVNEL